MEFTESYGFTIVIGIHLSCISVLFRGLQMPLSEISILLFRKKRLYLCSRKKQVFNALESILL